MGNEVREGARSLGSIPGTNFGEGDLREAINNLVVGVFAELTGRGPTKARSFLVGDIVVCLIEEALTRGERSLAASGRGATVLQLRSDFQEAMRERLVLGIEELTGRRVTAFLSGNSIEPDMASEVFVLDGSASLPRTGAALQ